MSIPALIAVLIATVALGLMYFRATPFSANPEVFIDGALVTLQILGASSVLTLVIAFVAGLGRVAPWWPVRWLSTAYVEIFRGTSALVQLFWLFYVLPLFGPTIAPFTAGVIGVSLNVGAYAAVVVEASVRAVPRAQREAAIALNLSPLDRTRRIILPQAIRMMIPPFGNLAIQLFKLTALVSFIGISDLTYTAYQLNQTTYRTVEVFTIILFMYFAFGLAITIAMKLLERRFARGVIRVSAR